jgi:uncharacterized protein with PIN domain
VTALGGFRHPWAMSTMASCSTARTGCRGDHPLLFKGSDFILTDLQPAAA